MIREERCEKIEALIKVFDHAPSVDKAGITKVYFLKYHVEDIIEGTGFDLAVFTALNGNVESVRNNLVSLKEKYAGE